MAQPLVVQSEKDATGIAHVSLKGFMAGYDVYRAKKAVMDAIKEGCHGIVLDLNELDFIDSGGLGAYSSIIEEAKRAGIKITGVSSRNERVGRVLENSGMSRLMVLHSSAAEAIDCLHALLTELEPPAQEKDERSLNEKFEELRVIITTLEGRIAQLEARLGRKAA